MNHGPILTRRRIGIAAVGALAFWLVAVSVAVRNHPLGVVALWGAAMVVSMVGWGSIVNLWLAPGRWVDWGLRAGWGMTLMLVVGGYLSLLNLAIRPVLIGQVVLGVAAWLAVLYVRGVPVLSLRRRLVVLCGNGGVVALVALAYALAAALFLGSLGWHWGNQSDDPPLYWAMTTKLAQTGSMLEPYSARRVLSFGGQIYLSASFVSIATMRYIGAFDPGVCLVIVVALLAGHVGRSGFKRWHAVPLGLAFLLLFSLGDVRRNSASLVSSLVALLTLYRTLRDPPYRAYRGQQPSEPPLPDRWPMEPRRIVLLGALTTCCILLRTSNAAMALPFIVLALTSDFVLATRRPFRRAALTSFARVATAFAGAFAFVLLPWSIQMHQSCGTYFFPYGHSNITPGWTLLKHADDLDQVANSLVTQLLSDDGAVAFLPFAVVGLMPLKGRGRADLTALTVGALIGVWVMCRDASAFFADDIARYLYPYVVTAALVGAVSVERVGGRAALVAAAIGMHLAVHREGLRRHLLDRIATGFIEWREGPKMAATFVNESAHYRDIQAHIPAGKTVATIVLEGFRFDFRRNLIFSLDVLGGMGPKPGWPAYQGPEALRQYLRANGVDYLVWTDFNEPSLFVNREHWKSHLGHPDSYLYGEAKLQLDGEDTIEKLSAPGRVVYSEYGMTVVDLAP